ncbi:uncharacterized protein LOC106064743 [Biomphalaria glabrata]|uniref:Uncharacterized protein LOC106064743 n=2 Tax=Biomphalaria glabrata TaxID=6526 RepID=A0A9W3AID1_BIOGL|nr:uncharacterized protein LOC106064743 [Biomphalaria glabrata]KAI8749609.1 hypothetical protein BgiMline_016559 [Biomphalaria glabrata]
MAGGSRKGHKELLHKFKSKVIAKLFGNREGIETQPSDQSEDEVISLTSSSSTLSGLDVDCRAREVRIYGAQCCPTGSKHRDHINEPVHMVGSSSYLSDDEDSDSISAPRKRKRKKTHTCSEALKKAQQAASSSSSSSQTTDMQNQETTSARLTKNQRRKLKKKKRESKKKFNKYQASEFVFDSSSNNMEFFNQSVSSQSKEEHLKSVKEFLEAIWEIFYCQNPEEAYTSSEFQNLLMKVEQCHADELLLLFSVMSTLVLSNQVIGRKTIEEFKRKTTLNSELKTFVTNLFLYWTNEVMKS